ncbi:MAG: PAS domain-containing protein, partial [Daejeonella sp.]
MNFFDNYFFTTLFHAEVPRIILRTEPDHIIVKYNEAYQIATSTQSRSLEGVSLWDAFDPDEAGPGSGKLLAEALSKATSTKKTVNMPPFSYYVPSPNGEEIVSMWRMLEIIPFLEKTGECNYLLLTTNNITHEILSKEALDRGLAREQILVDELNYTNKELTVANSALLVSMEELNVRNAELLDSEVNLLNFNRDLESTVRVRTGQQRAAKAEALKQRDHLTSLFMQAPAGITVLAGPEFIFELVNPHYQELFPGKKLRGHKFFEALPELKGSLIDSILHDVYQTGEAFEGNEIHMQIKSLATDETEDRYFNFIYQPRVNADEVTDGILVLIFEITEMVINRKEKAKSDNLLKFSIEAADIGTYSIDAKNRKLIASTR